MRNNWQPRPGDVVVRRPRPAEMRPSVLSVPLPRGPSRNLASASTVLYGITVLLVLGTILLLLPISNSQGSVTPFMDAFFTATSAVTVTGLVVQDTPEYWSTVGQAFILALILIGGMGWMTMAGFLLVILRQRITLPQRLALRETVGSGQIGNVIGMLRIMVLTFLVLQIVGGALLTLQFRDTFDWSWSKALWQGSFHAVSGFNNAGFTILPGSASLSAFSSDVLVLGVMGFLIVLGGLSFPVMADLLRIRRFSRFTLDTKIVVTASLFLWLLGAVVIFALEYNEPDTLGPMGVGDKFLNAMFHSVSARAAGFSSMPVSMMASATAFFIIGLMFVGTASASVGGGIRLNTLGVLVATVLASVRARDHVIAFGRELSPEQVHRAIAVAALALIFVGFVVFILTFTEEGQNLFIDLFFETVSALGTVGLSRGITPELSVPGELLIIASMLLGRLGPLMLALSLARRELHPPLYRYARERVNIG